MAINSYINDTMKPEYSKVIAIVGVWTDIIINIIIATISGVLVSLALFAILRFKLKSRSLNLSSNSWPESLYQLIQFMIFFTPLTIVQLSSYLLNWSFVLRHMFPSLAPIVREKYEAKLLDITLWTQETSFTLMPLCTLVALSPYRKAVAKLMRCERRIQPIQTRLVMESLNGE